MLIASMLPFVDLFLAGEFYVNQREAEVHRFHSVLYLLSEIPQVTTEAILEWLERFSYYYQRVLSECLDQSSFLEEWLQESGEGSEHGSFRQILEDIMACDKVGVKEAFRDIVVKREFWMDRFRQHQEMALRKKEVYIQALLYVPFGASVTLYLILPFFYESMKSMQTFMEFI